MGIFMAERRVVVTGLGAVTPLGNNVQDTWEGIKAGKSGIEKITLFDATDYKVQVAGEVKNFDIAQYGLDPKECRKMARFTQFLVAASAQALGDAGFNKENLAGEKCGVMVGNGIGGFDVIEAAFKKYFDPAAGVNRIPPLSAPEFIPNEAAANVSMLYGRWPRLALAAPTLWETPWTWSAAAALTFAWRAERKPQSQALESETLWY